MSRSIGRYPGPVWTMIAWLIAGSINIVISALLAPARESNVMVTGVLLVVTFACAVALAILGDRTPQEVLIGIAVVSDLIVTGLILVSADAASVVTLSIGYIVISIYLSYWFSRRTSLLVGVMSSIVYLWTLFFLDYLPHLIGSWITITTVNVGISIILTGLIRDLQNKAMLDPLTGLLNRVGFEPHVTDNGRSTRAASPRQVLVVDLDGFKEVNDTYGHEAGDEILRELGYAWRHTLRAGDIAVRSGGDEFVIVLPHTTEKIAWRIVDRLRDVTPLGFSVGIAEWPVGKPFDEVARIADGLLYEEKTKRKSLEKPDDLTDAEGESADDTDEVSRSPKPSGSQEWGNS